MSERKLPKQPPSTEARPLGQHGELVLYPTEDGSARLYLRAEHGTVWLSQAELAELFQTSVPNINIHIKNVLAEGELQGEATIKDHLIVRTEGARQHTHNFMAFSEGPLQKGAGQVGHERMQQVAHERSAELDAKRREAEALAADSNDIRELEGIARYKEGGKE